MARRPDYVTVIEGKRGNTYEARADSFTPEGRRVQHRKRFKTVADAVAWHNAVGTDVRRGVHVGDGDGRTLQQAIDEYLDGLEVRPNTLRKNIDVLRPAVAMLGSKELTKVTRVDIEKLLRDLRTGGVVPSSKWRKPGKRTALEKKVYGSWSGESIRMTLRQLVAVLKRAEQSGLVRRNVAALVKPPAVEAFEHETLTVEQMQQLFVSLESDRLEHLHHIALQIGARRGEIGGLRWPKIDLVAQLMTLDETRIQEDGAAVAGKTKTVKSTRVIPIPDTLLPVLKRAATRSKAERLAAGSAWVGKDYVVANELGRPYHPSTFDKYWTKALETAGVPHVRLHDARHTAGTIMHLNGVPIAVIAAVLGHTDASFTQRTYAHSQDDALRDGMATYAAAMAKKAK